VSTVSEAATIPAEVASKRTLVVGAGAVGSFLGAVLALAGHDVTLVRIFEPDSEKPVTLVRPDGRRATVPVHRRTRTADAADPTLILVAVKMPALREALQPASKWPRVPTLTVENGIGAEEIAAEVRPDALRLAGSLTAPAHLESEDEVHWLGRGGIGLAAVNPGAETVVPGLVEDFRRGGMRAARIADARSMKWSKLLANLIGNASGAILDMGTGDIYRDGNLFAMERAQLRETLAVMRREGLRPVAIPGAPMQWFARGVALPAWLGRPILARAVGGARAGKLQSLRLNVRSAAPDDSTAEPLEVAWMNGAVAGYGERAGVATPVNARLSALADEVAADPARRAYFRHHPERLLAELAGEGGTL
jgi:2-dehydropantoate 2-reductase